MDLLLLGLAMTEELLCSVQQLCVLLLQGRTGAGDLSAPTRLPNPTTDIKAEPAHLLLVQKLLQVGLVLWGLRVSQELQVLDLEGLWRYIAQCMNQG